MNAKIERLSRLYHVIFIKHFIPIAVIPYLLVTSVNYYILDWGNDSYFLPFPLAYVAISNIAIEIHSYRIFHPFSIWFYHKDCHSIGKHHRDICSLCWQNRLSLWVYQLLEHFQYAFSVDFAGFWHHLFMILLMVWPISRRAIIKKPNAAQPKLKQLFSIFYRNSRTKNSWVWTNYVYQNRFRVQTKMQRLLQFS